MADVFVTSSTYFLGIIGIAANVSLIFVILRCTPNSLKDYSRLMLGSAICDTIGLVAVVGTSVREVLFDFNCFFEFYGVCTWVGSGSCFVMFGIQIAMYSTSVMMLCFCFFYRYCLLDQISTLKIRKICVIFIPVIIITNVPLGAMFSTVMMIDSVDSNAVEEYVKFHSNAPQILGITNLSEVNGLILLAYSVVTSFVPFIMSIFLRYLTIRKSRALSTSMSQSTQSLHEVLIKVLNAQLFLTAIYFVGCSFFLAEFFKIPLISNSSILAIPCCNLQNVCTPIANMIIITPYRRKITQYFKKNNATSQFVVAQFSAFSQSTSSRQS